MMPNIQVDVEDVVFYFQQEKVPLYYHSNVKDGVAEILPWVDWTKCFSRIKSAFTGLHRSFFLIMILER